MLFWNRRKAMEGAGDRCGLRRGLSGVPVIGDAADLGFDSSLDLGFGSDGDDVVGAFAGREIESQETLDFGLANGGKSAGEPTPIALDEERDAEEIADPADADLGAEQGAIARLPVLVAGAARLFDGVKCGPGSGSRIETALWRVDIRSTMLGWSHRRSVGGLGYASNARRPNGSTLRAGRVVDAGRLDCSCFDRAQSEWGTGAGECGALAAMVGRAGAAERKMR
jgi:hypothetical protein